MRFWTQQESTELSYRIKIRVAKQNIIWVNIFVCFLSAGISRIWLFQLFLNAWAPRCYFQLPKEKLPVLKGSLTNQYLKQHWSSRIDDKQIRMNLAHLCASSRSFSYVTLQRPKSHSKQNKTEYKSNYFAGKAALHTICGFQYHAEMNPCQVAHKRLYFKRLSFSKTPFVFHRRKKVIQVWNNLLRVSKW